MPNTKTNYIQDGVVLICFWRKIVAFNNMTWYKDNCLVGCPHFNGTAQGDGVECLADLGDSRPIVFTNEEMKLLAPRVMRDEPAVKARVKVGTENE